MDYPLVTAVMITGKAPERHEMAVESMRAFMAQTYPNCQLLIVNTGAQSVGYDYLTHTRLMPSQRYEERMIAQGDRTLGELRNWALDYIAVDWPKGLVIQWDDDDAHGPERIALQVERARTFNFERPVTLWRQIRYSFATDTAFVYYGGRDYGIFGTVLHPPTKLRYEAVGKHEDSRFLKCFGEVALCAAEPETYVRFVHDQSTWSAQHTMGVHAQKRGKWLLPTASQAALRTLLDGPYKAVADRHRLVRA